MKATERKLVVLEKKKAGRKKRKPRSGAAKMREAADKAVGRECKPIVNALSENGKKGQMLSAKFLYGMAHEAEELGEGNSARTFRSMALELTNSTEGNGDANEEEPEAE